MSENIQDWYFACCKRKTDINEHLPLLCEYGQKSDGIVELGVRKGESTVAFLNARSTNLTSYDIKISKQARNLELQSKKEGISFSLIQADDLKITIPECDLLFVDTFHSYDQLKAELELHSGRVRKWIIMHDTVTFGDFAENSKVLHTGLKRAIDEFLTGNQEWCKILELANNNGLVILERKNHA